MFNKKVSTKLGSIIILIVFILSALTIIIFYTSLVKELEKTIETASVIDINILRGIKNN